MFPTESDWIPFRLLPRAINPQNPPHLSTVARWALVGVGSPRVKLDTFKCGGKRYATREMIDAFIAASTRAVDVTSAASPSREAAVLAAEHVLDAQGV